MCAKSMNALKFKVKILSGFKMSTTTNVSYLLTLKTLFSLPSQYKYTNVNKKVSRIKAIAGWERETVRTTT